MTHQKRNRLTVTIGSILVIGTEMLVPDASVLTSIGALATTLIWVWDI